MITCNIWHSIKKIISHACTECQPRTGQYTAYFLKYVLIQVGRKENQQNQLTKLPTK